MDNLEEHEFGTNSARAKIVRLNGVMSFRNKRGLRRYIGPKRGIILVVLACVLGTAWCLRKDGALDPEAIQIILQHYPIAAPVFMVAIYAVGVISVLPTLPLNLAAGMFWGPVFGGIISALGTTLGAVAAFIFARSLFGRPLASRFDSKLITEVQREFETKGWQFVAFARLNPAFPTGPLNYVLGLTSISLSTYIWTTFAFLIPPSIIVAYIGHGLGRLMTKDAIPSSIPLVLAISLGVVGIAALAYGIRLWARIRDTRAE